LIVVLDDASSEIYYAQLVEEESTVTVLTALREVVEQRGIFCSLYSDRGSHFWLTPKAGEMVDRQRLTQVGRAMRELGIEMIPAYSPQARGRSERNFGTWQRRLPQELRLRGIRTREEANRFLRESYIAEFNRKFAVAAQPESAFVPVGGKDLERIFTLQHERVVNRDNTISFANRVLQIERTRWRGTLAGCRVVMCEHLDGSLTVYYGPHVVGRFAGPEQEGKAGAESCGKDAALANKSGHLDLLTTVIICITFEWGRKTLKREILSDRVAMFHRLVHHGGLAQDDYAHRMISSGMEVRGGRVDNLKKRDWSKKIEENSKGPPFARAQSAATLFKNKRERVGHPRFIQRSRTCHARGA